MNLIIFYSGLRRILAMLSIRQRRNVMYNCCFSLWAWLFMLE